MKDVIEMHTQPTNSKTASLKTSSDKSPRAGFQIAQNAMWEIKSFQMELQQIEHNSGRDETNQGHLN